MEVEARTSPQLPPEARLIGILLILSGGGGVVISPLGMISASMLDEKPAEWWLWKILMLMLSIALLIAGAALLRRMPWARWWAMLVLLISFLSMLVSDLVRVLVPMLSWTVRWWLAFTSHHPWPNSPLESPDNLKPIILYMLMFLFLALPSLREVWPDTMMYSTGMKARFEAVTRWLMTLEYNSLRRRPTLSPVSQIIAVMLLLLALPGASTGPRAWTDHLIRSAFNYCSMHDVMWLVIGFSALTGLAVLFAFTNVVSGIALLRGALWARRFAIVVLTASIASSFLTMAWQIFIFINSLPELLPSVIFDFSNIALNVIFSLIWKVTLIVFLWQLPDAVPPSPNASRPEKGVHPSPP